MGPAQTGQRRWVVVSASLGQCALSRLRQRDSISPRLRLAKSPKCVVATLELVQHQLPESGHTNLLVTQNLTRQQCWRRPRGSVRQASGLVQTRLWPPNYQRATDWPETGFW